MHRVCDFFRHGLFTVGKQGSKHKLVADVDRNVTYGTVTHGAFVRRSRTDGTVAHGTVLVKANGKDFIVLAKTDKAFDVIFKSDTPLDDEINKARYHDSDPGYLIRSIES